MQKNTSILKKDYWRFAAKNFGATDMLAVAGIIIALRIAVKAFSIPIVPGLYITFDCYINAIGSFIYGPLMSLAVGAISDTIGAILFPKGTYFLPFILTEMLSGFIFSLFLWKRDITAPKVILSKFTVNLVCNIILTSIFMKWYYAFFGIDSVYPFINLVRIVKNLVLFPFEGVLISLVLWLIIPGLKRTSVADKNIVAKRPEKKHLWLTAVLLVLSIALLLSYIFFISPWLETHNIKWL